MARLVGRCDLRQSCRILGILNAYPHHRISFEPGHPFWVAGKGWLRARDLEEGQSLRSSGGSMLVTAVSEGKEELVYNLVVADFNTYFVGRNRILVHDITAITDLAPVAAQ